METVLVLLDPGKLNNPDLDLRYRIPDLVEQATEGAVKDGGYDYVETEEGGPLMAVWLEAEDAGTAWKAVLDLFRRGPILDNDLARSAEIYISREEYAPLEKCRRVHPGED